MCLLSSSQFVYRKLQEVKDTAQMLPKNWSGNDRMHCYAQLDYQSIVTASGYDTLKCRTAVPKYFLTKLHC